MNNINIRIFVILLILFFPYNQSSLKAKPHPVTVNIGSNIKKMSQINLSDLVTRIEYIPLETKENNYTGNIIQTVFSKNLILILGFNGCMLYDTEGHFKGNIGKKGRGPGEYLLPGDIGLGKDNNIYIKDLYDLNEFDTKGSLIKKYTKTFLFEYQYYLYTVFPINDSLFLGHVHNSTGQSKYKALLINKSGMVKQYYENYILFNRGREVASGFEGFAHIYKFNNEIFYKEFYNDTLFYLDNHYQLKPKYIFDLGSLKEPTSERAKVPQQDMMRYIYLWEVFQTRKYLFIKCQLGNYFPAKRLTPKPPMVDGGKPIIYNTTYALGIVNKETYEMIFCKPTSTDNPLFTTGLYNDYDAGPRFFPSQMVNDSTMVMYLDVQSLKDHVASDDFKTNKAKNQEKKREFANFVNNLSPFDNPVLMLVTFRQ